MEDMCDPAVGVPDKGTLQVKVDHLNIKDHQCSLCDKVFSQDENLMLHSETVHSDVKTLKCNYVASETPMFGLHVSSVHDNAQNYNCESSAITKPTIIEKKVPDKKKHYTCNICGAQRGCQNALDNHIEALHPARTKSVKCEHCDFAYYTEDGIRSHVRAMHSPQLVLDQSKDNKCTKCKFAGTPRRLKHHLKAVHSKEKQHMCRFCNTTFLKVSLLKAHFKGVHGNIKDKTGGKDQADHNVKAVCNKNRYMKRPQRVLVTASKGNLVTRSRTAHQNIPTLSRDLTRPINAVHNKIKDKKGPHCENASSSASDAIRHLKAIHIKVLKCSYCAFATSDNLALVSHVEACLTKRYKKISVSIVTM
jgi:hypothetical protein